MKFWFLMPNYGGLGAKLLAPEAIGGLEAEPSVLAIFVIF